MTSLIAVMKYPKKQLKEERIVWLLGLEDADYHGREGLVWAAPWWEDKAPHSQLCGLGDVLSIGMVSLSLDTGRDHLGLGGFG